MNLPPTVQLLTASLDLQLVRLIRGAINHDRPVTGPGAGGSAEPSLEPADAAHTAARRTITPEPRFEPRQVITPGSLEIPPPMEAIDAPAIKSELWGPLPAPWQTALRDGLCCNDALPAVPEVKFLPRPVDLTDSGRMLDQFA